MRLVLVPEEGSLPHIGSLVEWWETSVLGLLLGKAAWAADSTQAWWNGSVGRLQPKERACILPGGLFHNDIGSACTETSPTMFP